MTHAMNPRPRIHLTEVAPRDGLQAEACFVPNAHCHCGRTNSTW